jgi:hypothetical protein
MGLKIDGIANPEIPDKSGETVSLKGMDISSLEEGKGMLNVEHVMPGKKEGDSDEKAERSTFGTLIGKILEAKKIFTKKDAGDDERIKTYWDYIQAPFLYIVGELFDEEGHRGAQETAAIIRYYQKRGLPIRIQYSVEGDTLEKDKSGNITACVVKHVACTIKPCNAAAVSGVYEDKKTEVTPESKIVLIKSSADVVLSKYESPFYYSDTFSQPGLLAKFMEPMEFIDPDQQKYASLVNAAAHHLLAAKIAESRHQQTGGEQKLGPDGKPIQHIMEATQHAAKAEHHVGQAAKLFAQRHGYSPQAAQLFVEKDMVSELKNKFRNAHPDSVVGQHHPMDSMISPVQTLGGLSLGATPSPTSPKAQMQVAQSAQQQQDAQQQPPTPQAPQGQPAPMQKALPILSMPTATSNSGYSDSGESTQQLFQRLYDEHAFAKKHHRDGLNRTDDPKIKNLHALGLDMHNGVQQKLLDQSPENPVSPGEPEHPRYPEWIDRYKPENLGRPLPLDGQITRDPHNQLYNCKHCQNALQAHVAKQVIGSSNDQAQMQADAAEGAMWKTETAGSGVAVTAPGMRTQGAALAKKADKSDKKLEEVPDKTNLKDSHIVENFERMTPKVKVDPRVLRMRSLDIKRKTSKAAPKEKLEKHDPTLPKFN